MTAKYLLCVTKFLESTAEFFSLVSLEGGSCTSNAFSYGLCFVAFLIWSTFMLRLEPYRYNDFSRNKAYY